MSTSCHIQVQNADGSTYPCMIYQHYDSYPDEVLSWLPNIVTDFYRNRGDDAEYCVAQILRHRAIQEYKESLNNSFHKEHPEYSPEKNFTGYGICFQSESRVDIDYIYTINLKDGSVTYVSR